MLKGIDPVLSPELLSCLASMGHGDEIALVDANFPAVSHAQRLVRMPGVSAPRVLEAVLSVMPLDDFGAVSAFRMEVVGDSAAEVPIYTAFRHVLARYQVLARVDAASPPSLGALERQAFYARARAAFAIVATGETRLYGNILLVKGVVRPANNSALAHEARE
jgi:L-fucose mutarotase